MPPLIKIPLKFFSNPPLTGKADKSDPVPSARQIISNHLNLLKQSASNAFRKFDVSFADINAAIKGQPNIVTSTVESAKMEVENGKVCRGKVSIETKEVELDLQRFIITPRKGVTCLGIFGPRQI